MDFEIFIYCSDGYPFIHEIFHKSDYESVFQFCKDIINRYPNAIDFEIYPY